MVKQAEGTKVLVIDDEESVREGCRQVLEEEGYRARVARDGGRGVRMAVRMRPSVVLIDLRMPGTDGMEVLKQIREFDQRIVCIVITGYGTIESAVGAIRLGARDFLCKPFEDTRLLEVVERGVRESGVKGDEIYSEPADGTQAPHPGTILDVLERAARDPDFIIRLTEEGSKALEEYTLSWEEKAALVSGDLPWIERKIGKLTDEQKTWLNCRLQQERW